MTANNSQCISTTEGASHLSITRGSNVNRRINIIINIQHTIFTLVTVLFFSLWFWPKFTSAHSHWTNFRIQRGKKQILQFKAQHLNRSRENTAQFTIANLSKYFVFFACLHLDQRKTNAKARKICIFFNKFVVFFFCRENSQFNKRKNRFWRSDKKKVLIWIWELFSFRLSRHSNPLLFGNKQRFSKVYAWHRNWRFQTIKNSKEINAENKIINGHISPIDGPSRADSLLINRKCLLFFGKIHNFTQKNTRDLINFELHKKNRSIKNILNN